jgi:hypothetical protein
MAAATAKKAPNGVPTRAQAQKAIAELSSKPRKSDFRGLALTLPPILPATFGLDMAELQASEGHNNLGPMYRLVVGVIGEEQWQAVREHIADRADTMDDIGAIYEELLAACTEPYGVTPGESEASVNS